MDGRKSYRHTKNNTSEIKPTETRNKVGWHTHTTQTTKTHTDPTNGTQMNTSQYKALLKKQSWNKFGAKKVTVGDRTFDSKKEARRAETLQLQNKYGIIHGLEYQKTFELQEAYTNNKGEHIRAITYKADFVYIEDEKTIVEDCKGFKTPEYKLKKKLFEKKYPEIIFRES